MTAVALVRPEENWDEDFVFQQPTEKKPRVSDVGEPRWSTSTTDWRSDTTSRRSKASISKLDDITGFASNLTQTRLEEWAEPGPSSPPRRALNDLEPSENWDDDFEDKTDSPIRPARARPPRTPSKRSQLVQQETENWDDDFEEAENKGGGTGTPVRPSRGRPPRTPSKRNQIVQQETENWDADFEEAENKVVGVETAAWDSSDDEDGLGFADHEDDKTVTARSRRAAVVKHAHHTPPPPVPPLPASVTEPFPRSPTMSVFSIPSASGRESVTYSSLAHLPLRSSSSALGMLPPSPPIHRERRRLRKKSRPPDQNLFELLDREPLPSPPPPTSPLPVPVDLPPVDPAASTKTPLLSRIGSVKKWGARKKRASTGPAEVIADESKEATPRASTSNSHGHGHSPSSSSRTSGWFFRTSGGQSPPPPEPLELKHERSFGRLRVFSSAQDSPTKPGRKRSAVLTTTASTPDGTPPPSPRPRRPASMQVPSSGKPLVPRQASHGTMTVGRSVSRSTFSTSTDDVSRESIGDGSSTGKEKDGHRGFMGGMRRISLVPGRHKRTKSKADEILDGTIRASPRSPPRPLPDLPGLPPPSMTTPSPSEQLLPPIELQPPSPPREPSKHDPPPSSTSESGPYGIESLLLRPSVDISSLATPSTTTPRSSPKKSPGSPQSASLGRSTHPPPPALSSVAVPRRNSLGDLKIPARISQAQVGLKRDLTMVREFASGVEKLKELQSIHQSLIQEAQSYVVDSSSPPTRSTSPALFSIPRPRSRARSNTNPAPVPADPQKQFAASFYHLDHKYKISWECAELLIELGGGTPSPMSPPPSASSAPAHDVPVERRASRKSRERAITLAGDESAPPFVTSFPGPSTVSQPDIGWRASTGRNDLSQRQLSLLREMLNKPDSSPSMLTDLQIPEEDTVNRGWRWDHPMSSTVTLPSEESMQNETPSKKRRGSRLGMAGIRDMLKSLTRSHHRQPPPRPFQSSSASASADSSLDGHATAPSRTSQRRRGKTSTGPDTVSSTRAGSPFATSTSFAHKSPRRPSLASIFRLSHKSKSSPTAEGSAAPGLPKSALHSSSSGSDLGSRFAGDDEDWDRIEYAEDLDGAAKALGLSHDGTATVRGRKSRYPYLPGSSKRNTDPTTPKKNASASHSSLSLWAESSPAPISTRSQVSVASPPPPVPPITRPTRLSNVEEAAETPIDHRENASRAQRRSGAASASPHRAGSQRSQRGNKKVVLTGSVRSAPPPGLLPAFQEGDFKLALTPETIRPLLDNAREVHARCTECILELRTLLAARPPSSAV
ncbi:hypothetical protein FA95DRAFT_1559429 [Auriscalpium vulgare]|uniref:Uncharacterized protein n=1 Tax=Auriscalpium vulgare TaxID=40419 RepID=A0ACB8RTZ8_9AGAM|nr:hypothetical protein FA95DRAFT_1559429 [Auriscalpium vulgare]